MLRKELGRELDRLLQSQVFERENAAQQQYLALTNNAEVKAEESDYDSDEIDEVTGAKKKPAGAGGSVPPCRSR